MKIILSLIMLFACLSAQKNDNNPTPQEIFKVYEYLKKGATGAILYDSRITSKVVNFNATDTVNEVKVDSTIYIWMNFMLPENYVDENFTFVVKKGPVPELGLKLKLQTTNNLALIDYRIKREFTPKYPGKYSVQIYKSEIIVAEHIFYVKE